MEIKLNSEQYKKLVKGDEIELTFIPKTKPINYHMSWMERQQPTIQTFTLSLDYKALLLHARESTWQTLPFNYFSETDSKYEKLEKELEIYKKRCDNYLKHIVELHEELRDR